MKQPSKDSTIEDALAKGYDLVQLKYDGWWCRAEFTDRTHHTELTYLSCNNRRLRTEPLQPMPELIPMIIGEYMYGREWAKKEDREGLFFAHDIYGFESYPYIERYRLLQKLEKFFPENFRLVQSFPIADAPAIWKKAVVESGYEGLVFKKWSDPYNEPILKVKHTETDDMYIVACHQGDGKYTNTLGSFGLALTPNGEEVTSCSGMTDSLRDEVWNDQLTYIGRCIEIRGSQRSDNGILQHPRFVSFRPDKD